MDYSQNFALIPSDNSKISFDIRFKNEMPSQPPDITVKFIYLEADCGTEAVTRDIQLESVIAIFESGYNYNEIFLPYGDYKLIASAEGYHDFISDSFTINADATGPIEIELQESL